MGSQIIWLPLLLIIYMEQVQGDHKSSSLKPGVDGFAVGKPGTSVGRSPKFDGRVCKCKVDGVWEENSPCLCQKLARRKGTHVNWRKLCQGINRKHKKCRLFRKKQSYPAIIPI